MAEMMKGNPAMMSMMEGMIGNMSQAQLDAMVRLPWDRSPSPCHMYSPELLSPASAHGPWI